MNNNPFLYLWAIAGWCAFCGITCAGEPAQKKHLTQLEDKIVLLESRLRALENK